MSHIIILIEIQKSLIEKVEPNDKVEPMDVLSYGNFFTKLQPFLLNFSKIHFVDGTNFNNFEVRLLEEFLGVEHELEFELDETKGFNCLSQPIEFCLGPHKGMSHITK